jgi:cardiolipin synthase
MSLISYFLRGMLAALGLVLALVGLLTVTHTTPVHTVISPRLGGEPPAVSDPLFNRLMELYTGTHLSDGNRVELLLNGDSTYHRLWDDLRSARRSVIVQMYFAEPGAVADSMRDLLVERARAGVQVAVLLDAFGAAPLKRSDFLTTLRNAGARVAWLRPIRWYTLNRAATRSHARIVVVDGRVGYTGGFGLADYWLGDGLHDHQWRETNVRFEGPAVAELQAAFAAGWAEATGVLLAGSMYAPRTAFAPRGTITAGLMYTVPAVGSTQAERFLALSIAGARKSLYVTNSYFVPNEDFRVLLKNAVK